MPRSARQKAQTRERILAAAGRRFRARGLAGAGVIEIMAAAGLTHGGFYAHFANKAELAGAALETALAEARASWLDGLAALPPADAYRQLIGRYLSRAHRDERVAGCPMAALASELAREDESTRAAFERGFSATIAALEQVMPAADHAAPRERALATMALVLGGLLLSRMVAQPSLSDETLLASRRAALKPLAAASGS